MTIGAPRAAVFVESDMPPVALSILRQRGIARALLAARPSGTRRRAPKIAAALLAEFDLVTASSQSVADELEGLKVKVHHVEDLKAYQSAVTEPLPWSEAQRTRPIWLAVSAHPEEYDLLFAAHDHLQAREPTALMVIAPRHPVSSRAWAPKRFAPVFFFRMVINQKNDTGLFVMDAFGHVPQLHLLSHVKALSADPWASGAAIVRGKLRAQGATF